MSVFQYHTFPEFLPNSLSPLGKIEPIVTPNGSLTANSSLLPAFLNQHDLQHKDAYSVIKSRNWSTIMLVFSIICALQLPKVMTVYLQGVGDVPVAGSPTFLGHWWTAMREHFSSVGIIHRNYIRSAGKAFAVPGLARYKVFISSKEHLDDLAQSEITQLSFNDAVYDVFRPHIIFRGFHFDPAKPRPAAPIRALQVNLKAAMPSLTSKFEACVRKGFADEIETSSSDWMPLRPQATCQRIMEHVNNLVIAGDSLGTDPEFVKKSMRYTVDVVLTSEIFRFTPTILRDPIGHLIMKWSGACDYIYTAMVNEMTKRQGNSVSDSEKPQDFLQWLLNSTRDRSQKTISRLSQNALGMIFGGAHQGPMLVSFALYNLCRMPEYIEPLREEIKATEHLGSDRWDQMHLMDSFLKETARLQPSLALTVPRKVNSTFTFSDGMKVPAGNWICVPGRDLMRDPRNYANPEEFQGFRFATRTNTSDRSPLTEASHLFPFWGSIKRPCPGRFYAALITKIVLAEFVANYDMTLERSNSPMTFTWGFNYIPHPLTKICVRRRKLPQMP